MKVIPAYTCFSRGCEIIWFWRDGIERAVDGINVTLCGCLIDGVEKIFITCSSVEHDSVFTDLGPFETIDEAIVYLHLATQVEG